jgi:hypothetical protein
MEHDHKRKTASCSMYIPYPKNEDDTTISYKRGILIKIESWMNSLDFICLVLLGAIVNCQLSTRLSNSRNIMKELDFFAKLLEE